MAISTVTETVNDGGLNVTTPASMLAIVIGPGSGSVTANELNLYSDVNSLKSVGGEGLGVEQAASILTKGGRPVGWVRSNASVAAVVGLVTGAFTEDGTVGSITQGATGPTIAVDATNTTYTGAVVITITGTDGALGTMEFTYTVGGSPSGEGTIVSSVSGIHTLVNGAVVTFASGSYVAAETYSFTVTQGGGALSVTGTPNYDTITKVEILSDGGRGVATFRYSCDGYSGDKASERTYTETLTVPTGGTYVQTGMGTSLVFADETFYAGDVYTFSTTAATLNATDLTNAFAPIIADTTTPWRFAVVATSAGIDSTAHALLAAGLQTQLDSLASGSRYKRGIIATGGSYSADAAAAKTAFSAVTGARIMTPFSRCRRYTSKPLPGFAFPSVNVSDVFAARAAGSLMSTDLKRTRSGALSEVVTMFHDEYKSPSTLDSIQVSTLRTWDGKGASAYIACGLLKSGVGSDFTVWPRGLVMDVACETAHQILVDEVGRGLRTTTNVVGGTPYPGVIDARDRIPINDKVNDALQAQLTTPLSAEGTPGHVQSIVFRISDTHNFASTGVLMYTVSVKPLFYVKDVVGQFGFVVEIPEE